jgi:STE24 endopeptidase
MDDFVSPALWTAAFLLALISSTTLKIWLASRQIRHVAGHRHSVPQAFATQIPLAAHERAAAYTIARTRLVLIDVLLSAALLLALTLFGGLQVLWDFSASLVDPSALLTRQLLVVAIVGFLGSIVDLPLDAWRRFRVEQRFGFNRLTVRLWLSDLGRGLLLSLLLGLPLVAVILTLMQSAGTYWWLWAWCVWVAFSLGMMIVFPMVFARWFNRFEPLPDGPLRSRLEALLERCGFPAGGLFVMDGSRRSAHGNAYFTGFGRARRIVLFDTLIQQLGPDEIEAVLAHEIGHFRLRHIGQRVLIMQVSSLAGMAILGWLASQAWFFQGLGLVPTEGLVPGLALMLFMLVAPVFATLLGPLGAILSRRHEFEADAYAVKMTSREALTRALVALYRDNAATLTPDPLHSAFHDSHPPASLRIGRLQTA